MMKMLRCVFIASFLIGSLAIRQKKAVAQESTVALSGQGSAFHQAVGNTTGMFEVPTMVGCHFETNALFEQIRGHVLAAIVWVGIKILFPGANTPGDFIKVIHKDLDPAFYLVSDEDGWFMREVLGLLFQSSFYAFTANTVSKVIQLHDMEKTAKANNDTLTLAWVDTHPLGSYHNFLNSYLEGTPGDDWDLPPLKDEEHKKNKESTDKVMKLLSDTSSGSPMDELRKAAKPADWKPEYPWHEEPQLTEDTAEESADKHAKRKVVVKKARRKDRHSAVSLAGRQTNKRQKRAGSNANYNPTRLPSEYNPTRPPFELRGTRHGNAIPDIYSAPTGLVSAFSTAIPGPAATVTCGAATETPMLGVPTFRSGGWGGCVKPGDDIKAMAEKIPLVFWGCCDYQYVTYTTCGMNKAWGDTLLEECLASRAEYYSQKSCLDNQTRLDLIRNLSQTSEDVYNASQLDSCVCRSPANLSQYDPDAYADRELTPMDRCRNAKNGWDRCVCYDDSARTLFTNNNVPKVYVESSADACKHHSQSEFPAAGVFAPGQEVKIKADPQLPPAFHDKVGHIVSMEWMNHFEGEPGHAVRSIRTGKAIQKPGDWDWDMVQKKTLGPVLGTHEEWVSRGGYIVRIPWMNTAVGLTFHPTFDQVEASP